MNIQRLSLLICVLLVTFFLTGRPPFSKAATLSGNHISPDCINCHEELDGQGGSHSGSHAIGVSYADRAAFNERLRPEYDLPVSIVLSGGIVTCETCHGSEPHEGEILVIDNRGSALCSACHLM